ncbi:hypothetical protein RBU49_06815 [Clostridium sp. MB40-C1]|uniref:hypothetical protein n=1 Tax=Clostridium sp. MB40-C1 TaxID=3070996 RepID=UPI0027E1D07A|nr:hypothetical protein [Clostridium sp. MB40-C1]WMJ81954.1 hypothetical protein RBU49_06815 [Clostridium sp. MB40-C1]
MFKIGMKLKIKCKIGNKKGFRFFKGTVAIATKYFIVVQGKNYRECFKYSDFECGDAVLI